MADAFTQFYRDINDLEREARGLKPRRRGKRNDTRSPVSRYPALGERAPLPQYDDLGRVQAEESARIEAERAIGERRLRERMTPLGPILAPFANAISDEDRRGSIGRAAVAARDWALSDTPILPPEWFEGEVDTGAAVRAAPGAIANIPSTVAREAPRAASGVGNFLESIPRASMDRHPGMMAQQALAADVAEFGPQILRGITIAPFENERALQDELDYARARQNQSEHRLGGARGLTEAGNISLQDRPRVSNTDGSVSTVRTISIETPRGETLIPTVSDDGRIMSDDEAIAQFERTGRHFGIFDSPENATNFAQELHSQQESMFGTRDLADAANVETLFAGLNLGFAPADVAAARALGRQGALRARPTETPSPIDVDFAPAADAAGAIRAVPDGEQVRFGEQLNRDGSVSPASPIDFDAPDIRLAGDLGLRNRLNSGAAPIALGGGAIGVGALLSSDAQAAAGEGGEGVDWGLPALGVGALGAAGVIGYLRARQSRGLTRGVQGQDSTAALRREERIGAEALQHLGHLDDAERIEALSLLRAVDDEGFDEAVAILRGDMDEGGNAIPAATDAALPSRTQGDYEAALRQYFDEMSPEELDDVAIRFGVDPDAPNVRELTEAAYLRAHPTHEHLEFHGAAINAAADSMWDIGPQSRAQIAEQLGSPGTLPIDLGEAFVRPLTPSQRSRLNSLAAPIGAGVLGGALLAGGEADAEDRVEITGLDMTGAEKIGADRVTDLGDGRTRRESSWELPDGRVVNRVIEQDLRTQEFSRPRFYEPNLGIPGPAPARLGDSGMLGPNSEGVMETPLPPSLGEPEQETPLALRALGAVGAGLIGRGASARMGARGLARDVGTIAPAMTFDAVVTGGDDPLGTAALSLAPAALGRVGEASAPALRGLAERTAADFAAPGVERQLLEDPQFLARGRAFAETLPFERPRARGIIGENYHVDVPREGLPPLSLGDREAAEQGFFRDLPNTGGQLSARDEFRAASPIEQQAWMDRVGFEIPRPGESVRPRLPPPQERAPVDPFTEPNSGRSVFGEPRRPRRAPAPLPPLEDRAAQSGSKGALQRVPVSTLRTIAGDLGIEAQGVKAADLRRALIRELPRVFDSTREMVAFLGRYGISGALLGVAISEGVSDASADQ